MKKLIICTFTILLASVAISSAAPDKAALLKKEKAAWQAFKEKNAAGFQKVVSATEVSAYEDGFYDLAGEIKGMKDYDMKSFAISDYKVTAEGSDLAISTYKVTVKRRAQGKDATEYYNAASVWQNKNGSWQAIFHTNITTKAGS